MEGCQFKKKKGKLYSILKKEEFICRALNEDKVKLRTNDADNYRKIIRKKIKYDIPYVRTSL